MPPLTLPPAGTRADVQQVIELQDVSIFPMPFTRHHCREAGYSRGQGRGRCATKTYNSRKASCGHRRGERTGCAWRRRSPDPRLIRLLTRQAARDFVQAETDSLTRDRLPERGLLNRAENTPC